MFLVVMPDTNEIPNANELRRLINRGEERSFEFTELVAGSLPEDMRTGEWIFNGLHIYTIFKRVAVPYKHVVRSGDLMYEIMYIVREILIESDEEE